jgi:ribonuclease HI
LDHKPVFVLAKQRLGGLDDAGLADDFDPVADLEAAVAGETSGCDQFLAAAELVEVLDDCHRAAQPMQPDGQHAWRRIAFLETAGRAARSVVPARSDEQRLRPGLSTRASAREGVRRRRHPQRAVSHKARYISPAEGALTAFTDGASLPKPRRGGIGIRFVYSDSDGNETAWDSQEPGFAGATNNQMELMAVIIAMKEMQGRRFRTDLLERATKVDIYTDSQYVVDNVYNACFVWPKNAWMTRDGPPVQNAELWKDLVRQLIKLRKVKRVNIDWGKGHTADNPHNKIADELAKESAKRPVRAPLIPVSVRRKKSAKATDHGSVEMLGQRLTIRIVTAEYLATQKLNKYRYEVMSPKSRFYGNVDIAHSENALMRPGHTYRVTMNADARYPMIVKCHLEVADSPS